MRIYKEEAKAPKLQLKLIAGLLVLQGNLTPEEIYLNQKLVTNF